MAIVEPYGAGAGRRPAPPPHRRQRRLMRAKAGHGAVGRRAERNAADEQVHASCASLVHVAPRPRIMILDHPPPHPGGPPRATQIRSRVPPAPRLPPRKLDRAMRTLIDHPSLPHGLYAHPVHRRERHRRRDVAFGRRAGVVAARAGTAPPRRRRRRRGVPCPRPVHRQTTAITFRSLPSAKWDERIAARFELHLPRTPPRRRRRRTTHARRAETGRRREPTARTPRPRGRALIWSSCSSSRSRK
jgi:hypothetical protein